MRQFALIWLLVAGAGCQGLHEKVRSGPDCTNPQTCPAPCPVPGKKVSAPGPEAPKAPEKVAAPIGEAARAAIAQEVLLMPRMVYMPFVPQTPTAPVRLTSNMSALPPTTVPAGAPPPPAGAPPPVASRT